MNLFNELLQNLTLLLSLMFIYGLVKPRFSWLRLWQRDIMQGVIFGIFIIVSMMNPFHFAPGLIYDGRGIIVAVSSLFGGPIQGIISVIMLSVYRLSLGGAGAPLGIGNAFSILIVGLLIRRYLQQNQRPVSFRLLLAFGFAEATLVVFWSSLVSESIRGQLVETILLPTFAVYPIGMVLAGLLFRYMERQVELAEALRTSEEHYRTIISVMAEGLIVRYNDGTPTMINPQAERLTGILSETMLKLRDLPHGWRVIHEDGTDWVHEEVPSVVAIQQNQPTYNEIMGFQSPHGEVQWLSISSHPLVKPGQTTPYGSVTTFADITTERKIKDELAKERNMLRTLIDNIPDYVFIKDRKGQFILSNKSHAQAVGMSADELVGKTAFDTFPYGLAAQFTADDLSVMDNGESLLNIERISLGADGEQTVMLTNKIPLKDAAGNSVGLIGISRDITTRKQLERQTRELAAERERVALLDKFITDISHDFKTPLTIINSSVYLLQKAQDPERKQKQIHNLETQAARLTQLFDDFLMMTNLDSQAYSIELQPVDMNRIVDTVVQTTLPLTMKKHHAMAFEPTNNLPPVAGDTLWLQRAITQVITNAVNFTPEGGEITVRTYATDNEAIIEVQDSGVGIDGDDFARIFDRLYRGDESRSTASGGSGLGLPIAMKIMEAHNGTITVESTPGEGSTFRLHLPLEATLEPAF